jgi:TatD DNase family protein
MAVVGTQHDTAKSAVDLAEKYQEGVYAIIGLHPIHTDKSFHDEEELGEGGKEFTSRGEVLEYDFYRDLAKSKKVVAVGECGLDFYRLEGEGTRDKQEKAFRLQIELAKESRRPLMLHLRSGSGMSAYDEAFKILKPELNNLNSAHPGDLHFFAGSIEEAKPFLDAGFTFSFTGAVTYPPRKGQSEGSYDEIIRYLPADRILAETDCPYVAPVPYRGQRNEPKYVEEVVKRIASIRGAELELIGEQILKNTLRFFGL